MIQLPRPLEKVRDGNRIYYGGCQQWCQKKRLQDSGCGVIGCAQLLFHITGPKVSVIEKQAFMDLVRKLSRRYLLVLPFFGLSGINMSLGMNRYFCHKKYCYRSHWGCMPWNIWRRVEEMLNKDIPVILAVGANFPFGAGRYKVNLYDKRKQGYVTVNRISAHFVTITDMDDEWIGVSSWGRKYYINKKEYIKYVRRHSNWLFSNILYIRTNVR